MKSKISISIIFCLTVIFLGCKTKDKNIVNFEKKYFNLSLQHHSIFNIEKDNKHSIYEMMLDTNNCHEYISFGVHNADFKTYKKDDVFLISYLRRENVNDTIVHKMSFDYNKDTLYSYFSNNNTLLYFVSGRYYYLYKHKNRLLNDVQIDYYKKHKDSIVKNGINEIPDFDINKIKGKILMP